MLQTKRMEVADWASVRDIRLRALADAPGAFASTFSDEQALTEQQWRQRLRQSIWYLAFRDGQAIGLAGCYQGVGSSDWHLISMWVDPSARGSGASGRLVAAVANAARHASGTRLLLWVVVANEPARRLYGRHGFEPTGHIQPLPSDPAVTEMAMVLVLDADALDARSDPTLAEHVVATQDLETAQDL